MFYYNPFVINHDNPPTNITISTTIKATPIANGQYAGIKHALTHKHVITMIPKNHCTNVPISPLVIVL